MCLTIQLPSKRALTHTQTPCHTHRHAITCTPCQTHTDATTCTRYHTHTHTHAIPRTLYHTHTQSLHKHTHTQSLALVQTHTHRHTLSLLWVKKENERSEGRTLEGTDDAVAFTVGARSRHTEASSYPGSASERLPGCIVGS